MVFDGADNAEGAVALADAWRESFGEKKCSLVFSAVAAKDVKGIVASLEPLAAKVHICPVDTPRALETSELAAAFSGESERHDSVQSALDAAGKDDLPVLVAGSLFLIGEAKALLQDQARMITDQ